MWGGRTGTAGTVLLPQEGAVQTAWRGGGEGGGARRRRQKRDETKQKIRGKKERDDGGESPAQRIAGRRAVGG